MGARGKGPPDPYYRKPNLRARWGPGQIARQDRDRKCVEMRRNGHDWDTIVEQLGYASAGHARDRYTLYLERLPEREDALEQRELEMSRLDALSVALEPKIANGDVRAIEVAIKLLERRARLGGFDQPVKQQITVVNDELAAEMVREWRAEIERKRRDALDAGIDRNVIEGEVVVVQPEAVEAPKRRSPRKKTPS